MFEPKHLRTIVTCRSLQMAQPMFALAIERRERRNREQLLAPAGVAAVSHGQPDLQPPKLAVVIYPEFYEKRVRAARSRLTVRGLPRTAITS